MKTENTLKLKDLQEELYEILVMREANFQAFLERGIERHRENNNLERDLQVILAKMQRTIKPEDLIAMQ
tara:strand:+ start:531 stop:737 length:207 start_codon:yes stop_codon:yes gene_type:complete